MITGAGIMFLAPGERVLFLKRGPGGDFPGAWCFPGGKLEDNETLEQCAKREAEEECGGGQPAGELKEWTRTLTQIPLLAPMPAVPVADGVAVAAQDLPGAAQPGDVVDFTTFRQIVKEEFAPKVEGEHVGWAWAPANDPPQPLHPGCSVACERLNMNELGVARAIRDGRLTSPQRYENVTLFALRITGTGVAYRHKLKEFVWRDPSLYLNDEFLARCNGLSVIFEHPKGDSLDSKEFNDRIIGAIMLPYIKGDEVWGIAKIYDDPAIAAMRKTQLSTSPAVAMANKDNTILVLEGGEELLIEGAPKLVDHLAICFQGVWDKGGAPEGVQIDVPLTPAADASNAFADEMDRKLTAAIGKTHNIVMAGVLNRLGV